MEQQQEPCPYRQRKGKRAALQSRHLWLNFSGQQCGVSPETVKSVLSRYGAVERLWGAADSISCFVSMGSEAEAQAVRSGVDGQLVMDGCRIPKAVEVRYAELVEEEAALRRMPSVASAVFDVLSRRLSDLSLGHAGEEDEGAQNAQMERGSAAEKANSNDNDDAAAVVPDGLILVRDFVSEEEERQIMAALDGADESLWQRDISRRVQHFGYIFDYSIRNVNATFSDTRDTPPCIAALYGRLRRAGMPHEPNQITANEYEAGQGIGMHVDTHSAFTDGIASLSLLSPIVFEMRKIMTNERFSLVLPPRSLLLMTGESRYAWLHGITQRKTDCIDGRVAHRKRRVSLTFRTVFGQECRCAYPFACESQSSIPEPAAQKLEVEHVHNFYDRIATHFSATRHHPWPRVVEELREMCSSRGDDAPRLVPGLVLDVGCGNGRHLLPAAKEWGMAVMGCDLTEQFVSIAKGRGLEVLRCDALTLPFRSGIFDAVLCIAVLHHLASKERRLRALQELVRVTKFKGRIQVTVWALEQDESSKRTFEEQDVMVPWNLPVRLDPEAEGEEKENAGSADVGVEEKAAAGDDANDNNAEDNDGGKKGRRRKKKKKKKAYAEPKVTVQRYCHVFKEGELEELIGEIPNVRIVKSYYDHSNWACIIEKIA